jgi:hypothetical protein
MLIGLAISMQTSFGHISETSEFETNERRYTRRSAALFAKTRPLPQCRRWDGSISLFSDALNKSPTQSGYGQPPRPSNP